MMKGMLFFGGLVVLGLASGLVAALCGVGGGIILVPAFKALGIAHKTAVASSLAVIIPTALIATFRNHQAELVDWRLVGAVAAGAVVAAFFGTELMQSLGNPLLTRIFAVLLLLTGLQLLVAKA